ncbi:Uncharacterized protein YrzB, UPF0473 family [Halobacillus karajensis]|uniref:UPF0473 protein BN983_02785 n=1 Tax=Halobacillus karajensis TaxID=195088 RepID=A0A024P754_9BACI|nr:DUF1292 domain-containing protein [Halobacillus karajensis]CDQ18150.1 hypothetical protein BN982_00400 [Halobacillus karajensis]CDQ24501.1 hypothetical protein BN983_02785 [Halobacillus karajensis]CDQ29251.1 hypothetical protein BN981_03622 [Halobacillus karajensis]SEH58317.1 Uncharacterized protein YrzB, UPF0473 family [Halobacillus karajensis]
MSLEKEERIIIPDENGEEHLFEVLFTFDLGQTEETYVSVVPAEQKEDEDVEVFTFRYEEKVNDEDDLAIYHIESDEEWELVDEKLNTLTKENSI